MSRFRTKIPITKLPFEIQANAKILSIGSCFSEEIGQKMVRSGLDILINPFGILFNPIAVSNAIRRITEGREYGQDELVKDQGMFHSLSHHGRFSDEDPGVVLSRVNSELQEAHTQLPATNLLIVTLGSAWAYRHVTTDQIVANCHRIPQKEFDKVMIKSDEIVNALGQSIDSLSSVCRDVQVLFTVSPVRHWKDGPQENQVSKAHLRIACDELVSSRSNCHYFPSYELVLDELRDYRFFAEDMLHPSSQAIDFVWDKFQQASMSASLIDRNREVEKLRRVIDHKSDDPDHLSRAEVAKDQIDRITSQT